MTFIFDIAAAFKARSRLLRLSVAVAALFSGAVTVFAQTTVVRPPSPSTELNTLLMHATFLISGPAKRAPGKRAIGTAFIIGVPHKDEPKVANIVIVTAAHVLEDIDGDKAVLLLRRKGDDGAYIPLPFEFSIRDNGRPLYVKHTTADVVAMYADLPDEVPITGLPPDALVTDKGLEEIDLHPGDEAFVLGFPLGVSSAGAFPLLRVGHIMSYPITPMKKVGRIDLDLFVNPGNSGGPVYFNFVNRLFNNQIHLGVAQGILGLIIQEVHSVEFADRPLNYGIVVPAPFIRETIDMLPQLTGRAMLPPPPQPDYTGTVK